MTEPVDTPAQPDNPGQQAQTPTGTAPVDWENRYKGSVAKIEQLTLENRGLQAQLAQKTSEIEQLRVQLGTKETENQIAVVERDKTLSTQTATITQLTAENKELKAFQAKVNMALELKRPELVQLVKNIPSVEDPEVLKNIMSDFAGFADGLVRQREQQLMAGITPGAGGGAAAPAAPSSREAWLKRINDLPLGSPDRLKALDDYGNWLQTQHPS